MRLLFGFPDEVKSFVARHIEGGDRGFADEATAIGVLDENAALVGGMVFHNYSPESGVIEISSAADDRRWLASNVRWAMFSYPFDQLGCQMVILRVAEDNVDMVRIAKAYGFTGYLIPRLRGRDRHEFIFTLTDDAWRSSRFYKRDVTYGKK